MKIKINKTTPLTEDELDIQAFEQDVALFNYLDRVEKGQLTPQEKKERDTFISTIVHKKEK